MIEGLLFDMDGVVIDSEPFNDKACADLLKIFEKPYDRDILKPLMVGKSDIEGMNILVQHHKVPLLGKEFNELRKKNKKKFYKEEIPYMEGFDEFFSKIVKHFNCPVAIVTACNKEYFDLIDKRLKISKKFNGNIFRSEIVTRHKPAPDIYLFATKKLNINPKKCLVIEDSPSGIISGYRAGSKVISITSTFSKETLIQNIQKTDKNIDFKKILFIDKFNEKNIQKIIQFSKD
jgi:HAD superfamily hydrolase (TIGR01509 family)